MPKVKTKRKAVEDMDLDEFMLDGIDDDEEVIESSEEESSPPAKKKHKTKRKAVEDMDLDEFMEDGIGDEEVIESSEEESSPPAKRKHKTKDEVEVDATSHKKSLQRLKKTDPELYKFLKANDKELLEFSDGSDGKGDNDQEESEESEDEPTNQQQPTKRNVKVTAAIINQWKAELEKSKPVTALKESMHAFHAAVMQAEGGDSSRPSLAHKYRVQGGNIFNGVMRLCLQHIVPALDRVLHVSDKDGGQIPTNKNRVWGTMKGTVRLYLLDIIKLVSVVNDEAIVTAMLRHVLQLIPYFVVHPKASKLLLKCLVKFFSTGAEPVRVLGFLCIARMTRVSKDQFLETALKALYLAYVRNSKFTSPSTWPLINFMKRSLIELLALDKELAYQLAFVYIRQLAIHLRNALTQKHKDSLKSVYNWQYIHCLHLWADMLSVLHPSPVLQPLIYPLTQVIIGTIKLIPAAKYYPLRFQCCRALNHLVQYTDTFIPVLPLLTEVLDQMDFNKKHKRLAVKPLDLSCALKLSKAQLDESSFKEVTLDYTYELIMDFLSTQSHTIAFPELVLPCIIQLKVFVKKCRADSFKNPIRQLLAKIDENSQFITQRRKTVTFSIADVNAVDNWENSIRTEGAPLATYYTKYRKMRTEELGRMATSDITLDNSIPMLAMKKKPVVDQEEKRRVMKEMKEIDRQKLPELFAHSDDDSDADNDVIRFLPPGERLKLELDDGDVDEESDDVKESKKKKKVAEPTEPPKNAKRDKKHKADKLKQQKNKMVEKEESDDDQIDIVEDLLEISEDEEQPAGSDVSDDEGSDVTDDTVDDDDDESDS